MKSYDEAASDESTESLPDMDTLDPNKYQMVHHLRRQVARGGLLQDYHPSQVR